MPSRCPPDAKNDMDRLADVMVLTNAAAFLLTAFSEWIAAICGRLSLGPVELASESLAGCERLIGDGRAQFRLARSQPATPSGWTLTCSARRWSGSMSWR